MCTVVEYALVLIIPEIIMFVVGSFLTIHTGPRGDPSNYVAYALAAALDVSVLVLYCSASSLRNTDDVHELNKQERYPQ